MSVLIPATCWTLLKWNKVMGMLGHDYYEFAITKAREAAQPLQIGIWALAVMLVLHVLIWVATKGNNKAKHAN